MWYWRTSFIICWPIMKFIGTSFINLSTISFYFLQAFSGLDQGISREARLLGNTALDAVLNAQFLVQIGVFTAVPMVMGFILEQGLLKVCSFNFLSSEAIALIMSTISYWISKTVLSLHILFYLLCDQKCFRLPDIYIKYVNC